LHSKALAFFKHLLTCQTLEKVLTPEDIPLEGEELISSNIMFKGDIFKVLKIKETERIREARNSLRTTGRLPNRYHSVRGHMCKSKFGKLFFRKGYHRGNKAIGKCTKLIKWRANRLSFF